MQHAGWVSWPLCIGCGIEEPWCTCNPLNLVMFDGCGKEEERCECTICDECGENDEDCKCPIRLNEIQGTIPPDCGGPQMGCANSLCTQCVRGAQALLHPGEVRCDSAYKHISDLYALPFEEVCSDTDFFELMPKYNGPVCRPVQTVVDLYALDNILCVTPRSYMPSQFRVLRCRTTGKLYVLSSAPSTQ